ncbi:MAG: NifU family protein [Chloroflexi bacterium]|nr:NifU family protein [Chloroflexota bacterium]
MSEPWRAARPFHAAGAAVESSLEETQRPTGRTLMRERVQEVIDRLKPAFGPTEVTLVSIRDGVVRVQVFAPGCHGGPPKEAALAILEEELQEAIPEISEVVAD